MSRHFIRRVITPLAILALLVLSTAAVAHGHFGASSITESHCPLCMVVHGAKYVVTGPVLALRPFVVQSALSDASGQRAIASVQPLLIQDRAPPRLYPSLGFQGN